MHSVLYSTGISAGLDKQNFWAKIVNISYPLIRAYVLGAQKNRLIETALLSTHNIFFDWEKKKILLHTLI